MKNNLKVLVHIIQEDSSEKLVLLNYNFLEDKYIAPYDLDIAQKKIYLTIDGIKYGQDPLNIPYDISDNSKDYKADPELYSTQYCNYLLENGEEIKILLPATKFYNFSVGVENNQFFYTINRKISFNAFTKPQQFDEVEYSYVRTFSEWHAYKIPKGVNVYIVYKKQIPNKYIYVNITDFGFIPARTGVLLLKNFPGKEAFEIYKHPNKDLSEYLDVSNIISKPYLYDLVKSPSEYSNSLRVYSLLHSMFEVFHSDVLLGRNTMYVEIEDNSSIDTYVYRINLLKNTNWKCLKHNIDNYEMVLNENKIPVYKPNNLELFLPPIYGNFYEISNLTYLFKIVSISKGTKILDEMGNIPDKLLPSKTYYVYTEKNNIPSVIAVPITMPEDKEVTFNSLETYLLPEGFFNKATIINKKIAKNLYNSIYLPFSLSEKQVLEVFGEDSSVITFHKVVNGTITFIKHKKQDIVAKTPYLVWATLNNIPEENLLINSAKNIKYIELLSFPNVSNYDSKDHSLIDNDIKAVGILEVSSDPLISPGDYYMSWGTLIYSKREQKSGAFNAILKKISDKSLLVNPYNVIPKATFVDTISSGLISGMSYTPIT